MHLRWVAWLVEVNYLDVLPLFETIVVSICSIKNNLMFVVHLRWAIRLKAWLAMFNHCVVISIH
jgi:hypothetical protein